MSNSTRLVDFGRSSFVVDKEFFLVIALCTSHTSDNSTFFLMNLLWSLWFVSQAHVTGRCRGGVRGTPVRTQMWENVGKKKNYVLFFSAFPRPDGAVTSLPGIADLSASTADLSGCVVREVGSRSTGRCRGGVRGTPVRTQKWKNVGKIDVPFSPRIFPP